MRTITDMTWKLIISRIKSSLPRLSEGNLRAKMYPRSLTKTNLASEEPTCPRKLKARSSSFWRASLKQDQRGCPITITTVLQRRIMGSSPYMMALDPEEAFSSNGPQIDVMYAKADRSIHLVSREVVDNRSMLNT